MLTGLLSSPTVAEAAEVAHVSPATVWRYLNDSRFAEAYRQARRELMDHLRMRLEADAGTAESVLRDIAVDIVCPASARVSAARAIIEARLKTFEQTEIEVRIEEIEKLLVRLEGKQDARRFEDHRGKSDRFGR